MTRLGPARPPIRRPAATTVVLVVILTLLGGAAGVAKPKRKHRPGCGTFCRQAGPPAGGGGPPAPLPVKFFGHVLHVRGGAVKVDVKCILKKRCVGAIGVWSYALAYPSNDFGRLGAVNMSIPAGVRTHVTVPLDSKPLRLIGQRRSRSVPADVRGFEKGRCFHPNDCAIHGENYRSVRVTLS